MSSDPFSSLILGVIVGGGLCVYGLGAFLAKTVSIRTRLAWVAFTVIAVAGLTFEMKQNVLVSSLSLAFILLPTLLSDRAWISRVFRVISRFLQSQAARWVMPLSFGAIVVGGALFQYERRQIASNERDIQMMERLTGTPELAISNERFLLTDSGNRIEAHLPVDLVQDMKSEEERALLQDMHVSMHIIQHEPANDVSNCHGWVFTGGRYWVLGRSIDSILQQNNYEPTKSPRPGDLVVYRNDAKVSHTAIVRYVTDGMPVLVEGKWGALGVYLHAVDQSCYGRNYNFYRSPRIGHKLNETLPLPSISS